MAHDFLFPRDRVARNFRTPLTQFDDVFVHFFDCQMQYLPQIHFGEFAVHFLGENPRGDGWTFNNLCFQQFIDENAHHLLVQMPQFKHIVQQANLRFFRIGNRLKKKKINAQNWCMSAWHDIIFEMCYPLKHTLKTSWNFAMAAKLWEKLFEPKFNNVCTNTSILSGLNVLSTISLSFSGLGKSFRMLSTSSGVHFWRIATTNWWATSAPGNEATEIEKDKNQN